MINTVFLTVEWCFFDINYQREFKKIFSKVTRKGKISK